MARNQRELRVELIGRLDTVTSKELESEVKKNLPGIDLLIFDFTQLEYIASAGLRVLLAVSAWMEDRDKEMKIINLSQMVKEIFTVTGMIEAFEIEE
ncbi:MAG: STAS domain-containing protein [Lachnospiraceae bacterium]|nr:STAS domain-containing protein [Lachnospiraceae bacterium]